jgi:hypothetical protein
MSAVDPVSAVELAALVRRYLHDHHFTRSYVTFTAESQHLLTTLQSPSVVRFTVAPPPAGTGSSARAYAVPRRNTRPYLRACGVLSHAAASRRASFRACGAAPATSAGLLDGAVLQGRLTWPAASCQLPLSDGASVVVGGTQPMMSLSGILNEYITLKERVRAVRRIRVCRALTAPQPSGLRRA